MSHGIGESELLLTLGGNSNPAAQVEAGGTKHDTGKPRMHLLPLKFVLAASQADFDLAMCQSELPLAERFEPLITSLNIWYFSQVGVEAWIDQVVHHYTEAMGGLSEALHAPIRAFEYGVHKYAKWNWRKGMDWCRLYDGALRHVTAYIGCEEIDAESGLCHLDNLGACLAMLSGHVHGSLGTDDRRSEK